jgi:prepilin-type N-terminal cleavage/methylation domain-containing protein
LSAARSRLRAGFTVLELLVTLGIMAIISVAVVLTVKPRLDKTQADTLDDSWRAVETAIKSYRQHVGKYPSDVRQLIYKPGSVGPPAVPSTTSCGSALSPAQSNRWRGPYLAASGAATSLMVAGGDVPNALIREPASSTLVGRLLVNVNEVDQTAASLLEGRLDPAPPDLASGRVRWSPVPLGSDRGTLSFAMVIGSC